MFVHGTLVSNHLNWMTIPVVSGEPKSLSSTESLTMSVDKEIITHPTPHMTASAEVPMTRSMGTMFSRISWPFWSTTVSILMIGIGFTLLLA